MELLSVMRPAARLSLQLLAVLASSTGITLLISPPMLIVFEGGVARFDCSPFHPLEPPILLNHNKILSMETEPRLQYKDFENSSSLSLSNRTYCLTDVRWSDNDSLFRCVVGDSQSNEVRLQVYVPPELSGPTGPVYIVENSPTTTTFHYNETKGQPPSHSFIWSKNGNPFHANSRVTLRDSNRTVAVRNASREDSGDYTITAISRAGETSVELSLKVIYNEFILAPRSRTVEVGNTIKLRCRHRFGMTYSWSTNRGPIHQLSTNVQLRRENQELNFGPVHYRDTLLKFMCVVKYSMAENDSFESPPALLIVLSAPHITAPEEVISIERRDRYAILPFDIVSFPPYQSVSYEHNGNYLDLSENGLSKFENGSLLIRFPERRHAGEYTIRVMNARGGTTANIQLNIYYEPELRELDAPFVSQVNRTAHVPCGAEIKSNPPPTFMWLRKNESSSFIKRYSVVAETGVMMLRDAHLEDSGLYFCIASNIVGNATILVQLLILEPPDPPVNVTVGDVGDTWVSMSWTPPVTREGDANISGYIISGSPQPTTYGTNYTELFPDKNTEPAVALENSACVEFNCSSARLVVIGTDQATVTGLVPAVNYTMVVSALAHNVSLQSQPSNPGVLFMTLKHVPGIGSVTAVVSGPGSVTVTWTLAFSGGFPVDMFTLEYRCNDTTKWNSVQTKAWDNVDSGNFNFSISPQVRQIIAYGLEAEKFYVFRLSGSNSMGMGDYVEIGDAILSHQQGVPSSPSVPQIKGWGENKVVINTSIPKFGSKLNFSFSIIVFLNGVEDSRVMGIKIPEDYHEGDVILLTLTNVSYRGRKTFQALAINYLGPSLPSDVSLEARQSIQAETNPAGIALSSLMALVNTIAIIIAVILCGVMSCESHRKKKSMARRMETVNDHPSAGVNPLRPPSFEFDNFKYGPDERSPDERSPDERIPDDRIVHITTIKPQTKLKLFYGLDFGDMPVADREHITNSPIRRAMLEFPDVKSIHDHLGSI